jgi:hypothetical protein
MNRAVLQACLPWLGVLAGALVVAYLLVRVNRARLDWGRLRRLHADEVGSVQSLSFVLTLPVFVMVMLFIVQVSQLMIGITIVHYAAYAAARSASVWIPARLAEPEQENCISSYHLDPDAPDQQPPVLDPQDKKYGPSEGGVTYVIEPSSGKYEKIASAAVMACMPISPSRDLGLPLPPGGAAADTLRAAYQALAPDSASYAAVPRRLQNKLAYAVSNTKVEIRFFHKNDEPPPETYMLEDDIGEFYFNEVGWQDPITVTVKHALALLPGPGRLLARYAPRVYGESDRVSESVEKKDGVYVYPLQASATIGNEGEKPVVPYAYQLQ